MNKQKKNQNLRQIRSQVLSSNLVLSGGWMDWCWAGVLSKPKRVARYLRGCINLKCGFPFSILIDTEQAAVAVKAPIPKYFCTRHPFH